VSLVARSQGANRVCNPCG